MGDRTSRNIILWFFLTLFMASAFLLGWLIWPFISVIILATVVTGIFKPVYSFLNRKINSLFASLLTCFLVFLILFIPTVFFVGILAKEAHGLYLMGKGAVFSDQIKTILESSRILEKANLILSNFNLEITGEQLNKGCLSWVKSSAFFYINRPNLLPQMYSHFLYTSFLCSLLSTIF